MHVSPDLTCTIDIENYHLEHAFIGANFHRVTTLGVDVLQTGSANFESIIVDKILRPFWIPYTPFLIVPNLKVRLKGEGHSSIMFSGSATNTYMGNVSLEYKDGAWISNSSSESHNSYNFTGINGNADLNLSVEPFIDFKLYNQEWAKGTISSRFSINAEAKSYPQQSCKLSAGISAGISANLKMMGISFSDYNNPAIFDYQFNLYECYKPKVTVTPPTQCDSVWRANVTDTGSSRLKAKGFCWNTTGSPKVTDFKKESIVVLSDIQGGKGPFKDTAYHLKLDSAYYVCAYAINQSDTSYSDPFIYKPIIHIGDTLGGGIVFFVDETCKHGFVAAFPSAITNDSVFWWAYDSTQFYVDPPYGYGTSTAIGAGKANTNLILRQPGNFAARKCRSFMGGGFTDWYLPSTEEIKKLFDNRNSIPEYPPHIYWTSSSKFSSWLSHWPLDIDCCAWRPFDYNSNLGSYTGIVATYGGNRSNGYRSFLFHVIPIRDF